ncbi:MAG: protein kinase [Planctomycetota bacterium]
MSRTQRIAGYEIIELVGSGGMGAVYRARQISMDRIVALKVMSGTFAKDHVFVDRFIREARASAKLSHPNIIRGIDVGESEDVLFFAMEFVDGVSLKTIIDQNGPIPVNEALIILEQLLDALEYARTSAAIVHRDIKPDNILLTTDGSAKLCDLGLATIERRDSNSKRNTTAVGTPLYISPEQAAGQPTIDGRADIYSLGITMHHALTGEPPFKSAGLKELLMDHIGSTALSAAESSAKVDPGVCFILSKMTAKRPEDRYSSPASALDDLRMLRKTGKPGSALGFNKPSSLAAPTSVRASDAQKIARPIAANRALAAVASVGAVYLLSIAGLVLLALSLSKKPEGFDTPVRPVNGSPATAGGQPVHPNGTLETGDATPLNHSSSEVTAPADRPDAQSELAQMRREEDIKLVSQKLADFDVERTRQLLAGETVASDTILGRIRQIKAAALEIADDDLLARVDAIETREKRYDELLKLVAAAAAESEALVSEKNYDDARIIWERLRENNDLMTVPSSILTAERAVSESESAYINEIESVVKEDLAALTFDEAEAALASLNDVRFTPSGKARIESLRTSVTRERAFADAEANRQRIERRQANLRAFYETLRARVASDPKTNMAHATKAAFAALQDSAEPDIADWIADAAPMLDAAIALEADVIETYIQKQKKILVLAKETVATRCNNGLVTLESGQRGISMTQARFVHEIFVGVDILSEYGSTRPDVAAIYLALARGDTDGADAKIAANPEQTPTAKVLIDALKRRTPAAIEPGAGTTEPSLNLTGPASAPLPSNAPPLSSLEPTGGDKEKAAQQRVNSILDYISSGRLSDAQRALDDLDGPLFSTRARRETGAAVVARARLLLAGAAARQGASALPALETAEYRTVALASNEWKTLSGIWEQYKTEYFRGDGRDGTAARVLSGESAKDLMIEVVYQQANVPTVRNGYILFGLPADASDISAAYLAGVDIITGRAEINGPSGVLATCPFSGEPGRDYVLSLSVAGNVARLSVDGDVLLTVDAPDYSGGQVGIVSRRTVANFKAFKIKTESDIR